MPFSILMRKLMPENPPNTLADFINEKAKKVAEKRLAISERTLIAALRTRYNDKGAYAFFPHVRESTGGGACRTADALAFGLWPSRGLELEGFEIKISRGDWLKELKDPSKADVFYRHCDRWWLVLSDASIIRENELPSTWGLLVYRGEKLFAKVAAPKLTPESLDKGFVASILRKASEGMISRSEIDSQLAAQYKDGYERGSSSSNGSHHKYELDKLKESLAEFEKASGIEISTWNGRKIGELVKFFSSRGTSNTVHALQRYRDELADGLKEVEVSLASIRQEAQIADPKAQQ
jgi:hypothetical protein